MAEKQTKIVITKSPFSPYHPLNVNGRKLRVPVGVETDVPDEFLSALDDSNAEYRIVSGDGGEGEAGAEGSPQGGDSSPKDAADLSILDGTVEEVTEKLDGLSPQALAGLLDAEREGKNRSTMVATLENRINATNPAEGE